MKNIVVLVSGGGTNLQALIDAQHSGRITGGAITCVVSSNPNAYALERAKSAGIPSEIRSPYSVMGAERAKAADRDEKRLATSNAILPLCREHNIDVIVLAGYLSVLAGEIVTEYDGRIVNLHPALLPKFGGVGMWGHNVHEAVLAAGEKESGCTVHLADSGCDTGKIPSPCIAHRQTGFVIAERMIHFL